MDESRIVQVDVMVDGFSSLIVADTFFLSLAQIEAQPLQIMSQIQNLVEAVAVGTSVNRITYRDDEGDWCTLSEDSLSDAIECLMASQQGSSEIPILQLRLHTGASSTVQVAVREEAPATVNEEAASRQAPTPAAAQERPEPSVAAAELSPEQVALRELNCLSSSVDVRLLLPRLADVGLEMINDLLLPELFPLIEILCDFKEGRASAEELPAVLPELIAVTSNVAPDFRSAIFEGFKQKAHAAVAELRREQAESGEEAKEVEVHQGIVCDGCEVTPLLGARYKSLEQADYDLCGTCYHREERNGSKWARIRTDLRGSVVSSYFGEPVQEQIHHNIQCDMCNVAPIVGKRYRCLDLPDFDLCGACMPRVEQLPGLTGKRFEEVGGLAIAGECIRAFDRAEPSVPEPEQEEENEEEAVLEAIGEPACLEDDAHAMLNAMSAESARRALAALMVHPDAGVRSATAWEVVMACSQVCTQDQACCSSPCSSSADTQTEMQAEQASVQTDSLSSTQAASQTEMRSEQASSQTELLLAQACSQTELRSEQASSQTEFLMAQASSQTELRSEQAASQTESQSVQAGSQTELLSEQAGVQTEAASEQAGVQTESASEQAGVQTEWASEQAAVQTEDFGAEPRNLTIEQSMETKMHAQEDRIIFDELLPAPRAPSEGSASSSDSWELEDGSSERAPTEESWDLMVEAPQEEEVQKPAPVTAPSAKIFASLDLTTGVEAQEAPGTRGDVTESCQAVLEQLGIDVNQVFRVGQVIVPKGGPEVPVSATFAILNDGEVAWPENTVIWHSSGSAMNFPGLALGALGPGEMAQVVMDLTVPIRNDWSFEQSAWAIVDAGTGRPLGPMLLLEVHWQ